MNLREDREPRSDRPEPPSGLKDLYAIEMYRMEKGISEFLYDEEFDVFRFPEDGRFALCDEFADWTLLRERGYWLF